MGQFWLSTVVIFVAIVCWYRGAADSDETTENLPLTTPTLATTETPSTTQTFEHYGNYKEKKNICYPRRCPQLCPNFNNEHRMSLEEFKKTSFFACDHIYNKANSNPGDYNIWGNYSSWGMTCAPNSKDDRDKKNWEGLQSAATQCEEKAQTNCPDGPDKNFTT